MAFILCCIVWVSRRYLFVFYTDIDRVMDIVERKRYLHGEHAMCIISTHMCGARSECFCIVCVLRCIILYVSVKIFYCGPFIIGKLGFQNLIMI